MKLKSFIYKILITIVIVLFGSLISLKNELIKANIYENIYNNTLNLLFLTASRRALIFLSRLLYFRCFLIDF